MDDGYDKELLLVSLLQYSYLYNYIFIKKDINLFNYYLNVYDKDNILFLLFKLF